MEYSKPKVTIDLEEYQELTKELKHHNISDVYNELLLEIYSHDKVLYKNLVISFKMKYNIDILMDFNNRQTKIIFNN